MRRVAAFIVTALLSGLVIGCGAVPQSTAEPVRTPIRPVPSETAAPPTPTATLVVRGTVAVGQIAPRGTSTPGTAGRNPFALSVGPDTLTMERRAALAKSLGAAYYRVGDIAVDQWRGSCADCPALEKAALKAAVSIRANGGAQAASKPPTDLAAFARSVADIVDKTKPELLFVEHDDASFDFVSYAGLPHEYAAELKAACEAAHGLRIKCATGGIASGQIAPLLWMHYMEKYNAGVACAFVQRVLDPSVAGQMCSARALEQLPPKMQGDVNRGKSFLPLYRENGADYVSLNWELTDEKALEEAVTYLRAATNLPVVVKEVRLGADNPAAVSSLMQKTLDLGIAYAGWHSVDGTKSRALTNPDGSLRSTGKAFQEFVQTRFK